MRTLPWLGLTTVFVLSTGCPADDGDNQDTESGSSTGDSDSNATTVSTTMTSTTVSTSDATTDSTTVSTTDSTTVSTTDSTTVSTTDSTESGTTDPDTSGNDSGTESEGSGSSDGSSSSNATTGNDTGTAVCEATGDACLDCLAVDNCCAEWNACFDAKDCGCFLACVLEGGTGEQCAMDCQLQAAPPELEDLDACFTANEQACAEVCA